MLMYIEKIKYRAKCIDVKVEKILEEFLIDYPEFVDWSGSHNKTLHHYGWGELARHTSEVIELGFEARRTLHKEKEVDAATYFFAALFHDTGKMYDYHPLYAYSFDEWEPCEHRRIIHHLPRSAIIWHDTIKKYPDYNIKYHDEVLHAILAHHGSRQAGSPVAPKTHVAWLLHHCDSISARMDDAGTLDIVNRPNYA